MTFLTCVLMGTIALASSVALASEAPPAKAIDNGWDAKEFSYTRPKTLVVEETTPTADQVNFWKRPRPADADAPAPKSTGPATPITVGGVDVVHLRFVDAEGDTVPALLCTPHGQAGPFPVVVATHGFTSNKAQVCAQVAPELVKRGFAVLAADMPFHGERPGEPGEIMDRTHGEKSYQNYRKAVIDVRQLIDLAEQRHNLDTRNGVVLVGYSMGSWISSVAGPADDRVRAMVLMVGGAVDIPANLLKLPQGAATDPRLSIQHFAGRPILMLNGKTDYIVTADMTRRLWEAAPEPKKQLWYDCGHLLTGQAYADAAEWIKGVVEKEPQRGASLHDR